MKKHNRKSNLEMIELASSEPTMTKEEEFSFYLDIRIPLTTKSPMHIMKDL